MEYCFARISIATFYRCLEPICTGVDWLIGCLYRAENVRNDNAVARLGDDGKGIESCEPIAPLVVPASTAFSPPLGAVPCPAGRALDEHPLSRSISEESLPIVEGSGFQGKWYQSFHSAGGGYMLRVKHGLPIGLNSRMGCGPQRSRAQRVDESLINGDSVSDLNREPQGPEPVALRYLTRSGKGTWRRSTFERSMRPMLVRVRPAGHHGAFGARAKHLSRWDQADPCPSRLRRGRCVLR